MLQMSSPKRAKVSTRQRKSSQEVVGSSQTSLDEEIPEIEFSVIPIRVDVTSQAMLLRGLLASLDIGKVFEYKYQHKTVAIANTLVEGTNTITIMPSKWATAVAQELWEYEVDETLTIDPTTVDTLVDGWTCVFQLAVLPAEAGDDDDEDHSEGDFETVVILDEEEEEEEEEVEI